MPWAGEAPETPRFLRTPGRVQCFVVRVLLTWIGAQDPWRPEEGRRVGSLVYMNETRPEKHIDGPILDFLAHCERFDVIHLLYEPDDKKLSAASALEHSLLQRDPTRRVERHVVPVEDVRDYSGLYKYIRAACHAAEAATPQASFHILLTPGTPQVHATWVLLSKTVFRATTWRTSEVKGASRAEIIHIPFDIDAEFIETSQPVYPATLPTQTDGLIYASHTMAAAVSRAQQAGRAEHINILLRGETGVGKELFASIVHAASARRAQRLVTLNCAELVQTLAESTLFGHVRGAFTGATTTTKGLFEHAQRGTLFLDEVAELPFHMQPMLLRAVQYKRIRPIGSDDEIAIDARIITATNRSFEHLIQEGLFRAELYERLRGVEILIPPLRERREDIRPLADHFLRFKDPLGTRKLTPSAYHVLENYSWPGNVRELELLIDRLVHLTTKQRITPDDVRNEIGHTRSLPRLMNDLNTIPDLDTATALYELELLQRALSVAGTQKAAAKLLGLRSQQVFSNRLESAKRRAGLTRIPPKSRQS